jgi:hypothetical protein
MQGPSAPGSRAVCPLVVRLQTSPPGATLPTTGPCPGCACGMRWDESLASACNAGWGGKGRSNRRRSISKSPAKLPRAAGATAAAATATAGEAPPSRKGRKPASNAASPARPEPAGAGGDEAGVVLSPAKRGRKPRSGASSTTTIAGTATMKVEKAAAEGAVVSMAEVLGASTAAASKPKRRRPAAGGTGRKNTVTASASAAVLPLGIGGATPAGARPFCTAATAQKARQPQLQLFATTPLAAARALAAAEDGPAAALPAGAFIGEVEVLEAAPWDDFCIHAVHGCVDSGGQAHAHSMSPCSDRAGPDTFARISHIGSSTSVGGQRGSAGEGLAEPRPASQALAGGGAEVIDLSSPPSPAPLLQRLQLAQRGVAGGGVQLPVASQAAPRFLGMQAAAGQGSDCFRWPQLEAAAPESAAPAGPECMASWPPSAQRAHWHAQQQQAGVRGTPSAPSSAANPSPAASGASAWQRRLQALQDALASARSAEAGAEGPSPGPLRKRPQIQAAGWGAARHAVPAAAVLGTELEDVVVISDSD